MDEVRYYDVVYYYLIGLNQKGVNIYFQLWYLPQPHSFAAAAATKENRMPGEQDIEDVFKNGEIFPAPAIIVRLQSGSQMKMTRKQFSEARRFLGKTQKEMGQLLGTSIKSVQSFEQGWRNIPISTERQVLFLLASKLSAGVKPVPCWTIRKCPENIKGRCPAWEFQVGHLCWFVNGTICRGEIQSSWKNKMKICRQCEMFQRTFKGAVPWVPYL